MGLGYTPRPPDPVICDPSLLSGVELPTLDVLTVAAITTDPLLAQRLSDGWQVEHLEAFGVALACQQAGIPFALVLGISNVVGPEAHMQWLTHRNAAQDAARAAIQDRV
jgi:purine-nucleoside phosphorylase